MSEQENGLIVVRQLPVIEDQLAAVKESITERVKTALSLVCTEETYKDIKKVRADLNREYAELEARRKEVKSAVLAPYERFERVYKECAGDIYSAADRKLKAKIAEVEDGLKEQKAEALRKYFAEYRESLGIPADFVSYEESGTKVTLSESLAALKKHVTNFLDRIAGDLAALEVHPDRDEILAEYKHGFILANAMSTVAARHQAIEEARRRREEAEARRKEEEERQRVLAAAVAEVEANMPQITAPAAVEVVEAVPAPVAAPAAEKAEETYTTAFKVTGTLEKLKALKAFLVEGGYEYEQL